MRLICSGSGTQNTPLSGARSISRDTKQREEVEKMMIHKQKDQCCKHLQRLLHRLHLHLPRRVPTGQKPVSKKTPPTRSLRERQKLTPHDRRKRPNLLTLQV